MSISRNESMSPGRRASRTASKAIGVRVTAIETVFCISALAAIFVAMVAAMNAGLVG